MHQHGYIGRKMRLPKLKEKPAIVIAAFGSSSRGKAAFEIFRQRLEKEFPGYEKFWAYTSEIIRKKTGLPGLQETLARVEAAGFRKAVVQPLHIFPGTEYHHMAETCEYFPGLRVFLSETLLHRWDFIRQTLDVVAREFLAPDKGLNLLALHGTPLAADPVNIVYLGLERLVADLYPNLLAASIEGVPDHGAVLARIKRQNLVSRYKKIKIIPMMYLAGMHAEEDLMGNGKSWRACLEEMGFAVQCPMAGYGGADYFKGLAFYPEIITFFMERLQRSLTLAAYY
ncbi:MAG: sirohydrochlorin cobaltochelatase [Desulfobacterales bacterium]|nr:sirohydrochlorin cobaltochelatase [Desulfobacterales bacterium]